MSLCLYGHARKLVEILPEQFSESYRRLVCHDLSDDATDYTILHADEMAEEVKARYKGLHDLLIVVNTIRDSMDDDDEDVIPVNFTQAGGILNEFLFRLSEHMVRHFIVI